MPQYISDLPRRAEFLTAGSRLIGYLVAWLFAAGTVVAGAIPAAAADSAAAGVVPITVLPNTSREATKYPIVHFIFRILFYFTSLRVLHFITCGKFCLTFLQVCHNPSVRLHHPEPARKRRDHPLSGGPGYGIVLISRPPGIHLGNVG